MLPILKAPIFSLTLPTKEEITYRTFTVKEQKNLLIIAEGGTDKDVLHGIINLVQDCTLTKIDWMNQPMINLEYVFLYLRAKSVGEVVEMTFSCLAKDEEEKVCKHKNTIEVDVRNVIEPIFPNPKIHIQDDIWIYLNHLTVKDTLDLLDGKNPDDLLITKVKMIVDGENVTTEFNKQEFDDFITSIPPKASAAITEFFETQPELTLKIDTQCNKCGTKSFVQIKGVLNFFG